MRKTFKYLDESQRPKPPCEQPPKLTPEELLERCVMAALTHD